MTYSAVGATVRIGLPDRPRSSSSVSACFNKVYRSEGNCKASSVRYIRTLVYIICVWMDGWMDVCMCMFIFPTRCMISYAPIQRMSWRMQCHRGWNHWSGASEVPSWDELATYHMRRMVPKAIWAIKPVLYEMIILKSAYDMNKYCLRLYVSM